MMGKLRKISTMYYLRQIVACLLVSCMFFNPAIALAAPPPSNPQQVAGVTIDGYDGLGSDITKVLMGDSSRAVINWDSLDTLSDQELHFLKAGGNFAVLNRVIDGGATQFDGSLFGGNQGDIFIVNTRGIVFGPESFIQARNFVASGIDIANDDFMQVIQPDDDQFYFHKNSSGYPFDDLIGNVTNEGIGTGHGITAEQVALIGRNVTNKGIIRTTAPGGAVIMAAGNEVYLNQFGSNVSVQVSLGYTNPANRVVDNGGSQGTGDGTITADGGKVILAAGDIWSTAIEGIESLRAEAKGDITLEGAITASGHVEILGGQNRIISRNADININDNITAGSMRIKNGNDTEGEQSESGIYVADGVTLYGTAGDVVIEAVHDIVLGTGDGNPVVIAAGNIFLNADEDGYGYPTFDPQTGEPVDPYYPEHYGGGDLHVKGGILAMGVLDILGNDILLEAPVYARFGLTITGSTSEDGSTGWGDVHAVSTLDAAGIIEISGDDDTIYLDDDVTAGGDLLLNNDTVTADGALLKGGDDVVIAYLKSVTAQGDLTIEAGSLLPQHDVDGGEIDAESSDIIMAVDGSTLDLKQNETLDIEATFRSIWNRDDTDLVATSTYGTVTSDEAAEWQSITAAAQDSIILSDTGGNITTKVLTAMTGDIEVTADNYGQLLAKDNITAHEGDVALYADDGIVVTAGKTIKAGQDVRIGYDEGTQAYDSDVTLTGEGNLTIVAGDNMTFGGDVEANGDLYMYADNQAVDIDGDDDVGDVLAMGSVKTTNSNLYIESENIQIDGAIDIAGWIEMWAEEDITLGGNARADDYMELGANLEAGQWEDETGDLSTKSLNATGISAAGTNIDVDGTVYSDGPGWPDESVEMYAIENITLGDTLEAVNGTIWLQADFLDGDTGLMWAKSSITTTTNGHLQVKGEDIQVDGVVNIDGNIRMDADHDLTLASNVDATGSIDLSSSDTTTYLGGDHVVAVGNITLHNNTVLNGTDDLATPEDESDQRIESVSGTLTAMKDVDKSTEGNMTLASDNSITLGGDVTGSGLTSDDAITFEGNVNANGTDDLATLLDDESNQRFDAGLGTLDADMSIVKMTAGDLNLAGEAGIVLGGNVLGTGGFGGFGAGDTITFEDAVTADGTGPNANQSISAYGDGKLYAHDSVHKTSAGNLNMFGGHNGLDLSVKTKEVKVDDGATDGELTITGNAWVELDGDIYSRGDMTLASNVDADKVGPLAGFMDHVSGTIQSLNGDIDISASDCWIHFQGGNPTEYVTAEGDILLRDGTYIYGQGGRKLDAGDDVVLAAGKHLEYHGFGGALTVEAGDDIIFGVADIATHETTQAVGSAWKVTSNEDLILIAGDDIYAHGWLQTFNGGNITATAVDNINLYKTPTSADADGTLTLTADSDDGAVDGGDLTVDGALYGNMALSGYDVTVNGDITSYGPLDIDADYQVDLYGAVEAQDDITITVEGGDEAYVYTHDTVKSLAGNIDISAISNSSSYAEIDLDGDVEAYGDLSLFADTTYYDAYIYTKGLKTLTGDIDVFSDYDMEFYGPVEAYGNMILTAGNDGDDYDAYGDVYAYDTLKSVTGDITINSSYIVELHDAVEAYGNVSIINRQPYYVDCYVESYGSDATITSLTGDVSITTDYYMDLEGDITAQGNITLIADGPEGLDYSEDNDGYIYVDAALTTTTGDISISAEYDVTVNGIVDSAGILDVDAGDDIELSADVSSVGVMTMDAGDDIKLNEDSGDTTSDSTMTLIAGKTNNWGDVEAWGTLITTDDENGDLIVRAADNIRLHATTSANAAEELQLIADSDDGLGGDGGDVVVDGALYGNMTLSGVNVTVDGEVDSAGILDVDADEDIELRANVSSVGVMTMDAGSDIELNRSSGNTSSDSTIALTAGDDITIGKPLGDEGNVTANGNMNITAGGDSDDDVKVFGKLTTTNGGNIDVRAGDDVTILGTWNDDDPAVYESVEADGTLTMIANTSGNGGILHVAGSVQGNMYLAGNNVTVDGDVTSLGTLVVDADRNIRLKKNVSSENAMAMNASRDIILNQDGGETVSDSTVTLIAGRNVKVEGNLTTTGDNGVGNTLVEADRNINFGGNVNVDGHLEAYSGLADYYGAGSIEASGSVIADSMQLEAGAGLPDYSDSRVQVDGLLQTTSGDMVVRAHHDVLLGGNVVSAGNLVLNADRHGDYGYPEPYIEGGDVDVAGTVDAVGTIDMYGNNIMLDDDVTSGGNMTLTADTSLDFNPQLGDPVGDVIAMGNLISTGGNIEIYSSDDTTYLGGDKIQAYGNILLNNNTEFTSYDDQKVDAQTGMITANGWLWKDTDGGSLYLEAAGDVSLDDFVKADAGGVSIVSESGTIFTPGGLNDTLNVPITGYSNDETGAGVDLPYGPGKAAIVVMSEADLNLGEDAVLTAFGMYDNSGAVDDRAGVGFLDVGDPATATIGGILRNEGDPFDVAIYLASTDGDVDVSGPVSITSYNNGPRIPNGNGNGEPIPQGAMVIDAFDSVTFGDLFEDSLADGDVGDRLEVVSRITEWLFQAVGRLPYPYGGFDFPLDYTYVLRGAGLENPAITDSKRAWVLEDPVLAAPLHEELGEGAERLTLGLEGCPVLLAAAAVELGIPGETIEVSLANSFALNTDIQPCESCARLVNAATILRDEDGSRMAAMNQVFNTVAPAGAPFTPEMAASVVTAFAGRVNDGTQYATAIEYIDAFVRYIAVLSTEMGSPVGDSVAFVIEKYGAGLTESENSNIAAFVATRLESGKTFGN